jgi:hypothetical protein
MKSKTDIEKRSEAATPQIVVSTADKKGVWNSLDDKDRSFYAKLVAGAIAASAVGVVVWLAVRKGKKIRSDIEQTKSFGSDKHSTWAMQFKQAFENDTMFSWGTDEKLIRQIVRAIPSQEDFKKVSDKYKAITEGGNLVGDLNSELSASEYQEMLAIITSKPKKAKDAKPGSKVYYEGWAKRLHAAVNYHYWGGIPGTDDDAIIAVFEEFPTQQAFYNTAGAYKRLYGVSLWTDLDNDTDWSLDWRALLKKKPKK